MENGDNDTSADFKVFIHYLESKRLKTVSYKNNATRCNYERNYSISSENNSKRRLHECVGRPIKKLKVSYLLHAEIFLNNNENSAFVFSNCVFSF